MWHAWRRIRWSGDGGVPQRKTAGATIVALLEAQRVPILAVPIAGATRESFTVDAGRLGDQ